MILQMAHAAVTGAGGEADVRVSLLCAADAQGESSDTLFGSIPMPDRKPMLDAREHIFISIGE